MEQTLPAVLGPVEPTVMQHTSGPWILATVPTSVGSCHKIGPFPNGSRVATFACVYADGHRLGIDDNCAAAVELAANARLIAAAPDLLDALRYAVQQVPELGTVLGISSALAKAVGAA
jgi:hypothetical protein